ncbi:MAG: hypothetical protein AABZ06_02440 [Bdellovibrionota bacterium]
MAPDDNQHDNQVDSDFQRLDELTASRAEAENKPQAPTNDDPFATPAAPDTSESGTNTIEEVRAFAESAAEPKTAVTIAFPFNLLITGDLSAVEKEKLLEILSRENTGITAVDLEPQFTSGKILIPRISEFTGVIIIQALRAAQVQMDFGPTDEFCASHDTTTLAGTVNASPAVTDHPAESLPVSTAATIPGNEYSVIDVITASATLKTTVVEAKNSHEYHDLTEALKRELKYKAYFKGASAIVNFTMQLVPLTLSTDYKIILTGTAIKVRASS